MQPKPRSNGSNTGSSTAGNVRSALIAGGIAFVIYFIINLFVEGFSGWALRNSLIIGVGTFVVTWIIATIISALVRRRKGS